MDLKLCRGYSLLNLLITLSIISIITSAGIPSFSSFIQQQKSDIEVNNILSLFSLARNKAVFGGELVSICPSSDQVNCQESWDAPIIVFTDANNNRQIDGQDQLLTVHSISNNLRIKTQPSHKKYFQYNNQGLAHGTPGNIVLCPINDSQLIHARQLVINFMGRVRISSDTNRDGYVEDSRGRHLDCST